MGAQPFQPDVPAPGGVDAAPVPGATREFVRVPVHAAQLLAGATEVQIEHRGALYRLKQTSLGKLILTK
jgi:hemin uptake protein HemP